MTFRTSKEGIANQKAKPFQSTQDEWSKELGVFVYDFEFKIKYSTYIVHLSGE